MKRPDALLLSPTKASSRSRCAMPPIALMKLSALLKKQGSRPAFIPNPYHDTAAVLGADTAHITTTFTWEAQAAASLAHFLKSVNPRLRVRLGGIYPQLLPDDARRRTVADEIISTAIPEADATPPDYDLNVNSTCDHMSPARTAYVWTTRGCLRSCSFCIVPKLYGRNTGYPLTVADQVRNHHRKIFVMDDNTLSGPDPIEALGALDGTGLEVNFSQGLDARLITRDIAVRLKRMKIQYMRIAFDRYEDAAGVLRGINHLRRAGFIDSPVSCALYNHDDPPDLFFRRVQMLLSNGFAACVRRYNPLDAAEKHRYVAPAWTYAEAKAVEQFVCVAGSWGTIRPTAALRRHFHEAKTFWDAFGSIYKTPALAGAGSPPHAGAGEFDKNRQDKKEQN